MSDSEYDTIAETPASMTEEPANPNVDDVFAWIRPHSPSAQAAFDALVNASIKEREKYRHVRQFLHTDGHREERATSVFTEDDNQDDDSDDDDLDRKPASAARRQWVGGFKLSLEILPRVPARGWSLGCDYKEVDLALAPSSKTWRSRSRIAGRHARLFFHAETCRVMLEARHTLTTTKTRVDVLHGFESRVLADGELFAIKDCCYTFEYTDLFASAVFEKDLAAFMKQRQLGTEWSMNHFLSPTSVGQPLSVGKYYCSPSAFAQGTFGKVSAGWTQGGAAVAIKVFKTPCEKDVRSHEELMRRIGQHDNILQLLECVYHFNTSVGDAYSVYSPLAAASLAELIGKYDFDMGAKMTLVVDYLNGLSYLNDELGIMHRDIKPGNLAVTAFDSPKGVILDLDAATFAESSMDHTQGTISYLAPEVMQLKDAVAGQQLPPYDKSVDIWALGISAFQLLSGQHFRWSFFAPGAGRTPDRVTKPSYAEFNRRLLSSQDALPRSAETLLLSLIQRMTSYASNDRISPTAALAFAQLIKPDVHQKGKIVLKAPQKRPLTT